MSLVLRPKARTPVISMVRATLDLHSHAPFRQAILPHLRQSPRHPISASPATVRRLPQANPAATDKAGLLVTGPVITGPGATGPGATDPVVTDRADTGQAGTGPVVTDPVATDRAVMAATTRNRDHGPVAGERS